MTAILSREDYFMFVFPEVSCLMELCFFENFILTDIEASVWTNNYMQHILMQLLLIYVMIYSKYISQGGSQYQ